MKLNEKANKKKQIGGKKIFSLTFHFIFPEFWKRRALGWLCREGHEVALQGTGWSLWGRAAYPGKPSGMESTAAPPPGHTEKQAAAFQTAIPPPHPEGINDGNAQSRGVNTQKANSF